MIQTVSKAYIAEHCPKCDLPQEKQMLHCASLLDLAKSNMVPPNGSNQPKMGSDSGLPACRAHFDYVTSVLSIISALATLEVSRFDFLNVGPTSRQCLKVLPLGSKEKQQRVVVGDNTGMVTCFGTKKRETAVSYFCYLWHECIGSSWPGKQK